MHQHLLATLGGEILKGVLRDSRHSAGTAGAVVTIRVHHRISAEIDARRGQCLDQRAKCIGPGKQWGLVAELETVKDVLYVGRKSAEPRMEVSPELLRIGTSTQVAQGEL